MVGSSGSSAGGGGRISIDEKKEKIRIFIEGIVTTRKQPHRL
jgi:hypothetical protein